MPRPTVVVGLGGTGQWVLTWLKRDLMLANNGEMPSNVQLLEIDTATKLEAGATRVTTSGVKEEAAVVGGVSLGKEEFIYIGGDAFKLAEDVRDGKYRQIGMWYPAARWLASQTPAAFVLDDGAGRLRQFGRLAVFKDVLGRETESKLWQSLRNKIQKVQNLANEQRRLEIILVGSFAGGTGSGMLIDIAVILRMLAQQLGVHHVLRGFIALPSVFTGAPDEQMKARTFAAWRELNRFMVVDPDFPMPTIEFVEHSSTFRIQPKSRLFDCCYLVEGMRGGRPIAEEAKYGVFPMVSEVVSAIIDEEAGTAYAQWVTTNLAPAYARFPDRPMYSAVGAYTVQVPAHFKQEISSHEFAKGFLLSLLQPRRDPDDDGRLEAGVLALAATNKNLEDRGFAGRQRCERLFKETIERDGKTTKPTLFHARIAELYDAIGEQNRRAATIDLLARAGGSTGNQQASGAGWVVYFPNLGDDPTFEATRKEVAEHMIYNVVNQYKRKDGETGEEARARFRKISDDVRTRFGGISGSGEEIEEYYGQCGDALEKAKRVQLILFRKMVTATLTNILMGRSENPIEARSGKLGYARDYFDGAAAVLDAFLKLMDDVKTRRNEIKPELRLSGLSEQARRVLNENAGKKFLLFWESPNVRKSEEAYLQAQQRLVDVRREDILHTYVVTTAREMKEICTETRDALERWILHLSVGDASRHVDGIWEGVRGDLKQIKSAHGFDDRSPKVQKIVSDATIPYTQEDLKKALQRWQWVVEFAGDPPRPVIKAVIASEEANQENAELVEPTAKESPQVRKELSRENQSKLVGLMRVPYAGVAATANVADEIRSQYPNPAAFVEEIASVSAEPLFDGGTAASSLKKSNLIRVKVPANDPYFKAVEAKLREKAHVNVEKMDDTYGIQLVGSENPYKLTLVRTNDLYFHDAFASWEDCLLAYDKHIKDKEDDPMDPVLMQNFSAEQRAAEYERRLRKSGEGYRPLHPRVVMLLEDPEALRQFCYLGMLGLIKVKDTPKYHWELTWEREGGPETLWLTKGWTIQDKAQRPDPPDLFSAAHGYVIWKFNQRDGWDNRIDTEFAERVIERELEKWERRGGEEAMLQQALQPGGFVASLKKLARSKDTGAVVDQRFEDLAHVVEMIIQDRLDILSARTGGAGDSIFGGGPEKAKKPAAKKPAAKKPAAKKPAAKSAAKPAAKKTTTASKAKPAAKPAAKKPAAKPAVRKTTKKSE